MGGQSPGACGRPRQSRRCQTGEKCCRCRGFKPGNAGQTAGNHTDGQCRITGQLAVNFNPAVNGNGLTTDEIGCLAISKVDNSILGYGVGAASRATSAVTLTLGVGLVATNIIAFVWAYRGSGSEFIVSNSVGDTAAAV